jgi:hypothetical protein
VRDKTPIRERVTQRKTPTPERVKPLTLGDLQRGGVQRIECECGWCRHDGVIDLEPLIAKAGAAALYRDVALHYCCSVCGWRGTQRMAGLAPREEPQEAEGEGAVAPVDGGVSCGAYGNQVDPNAQTIEKRGAYVRALQQRWPELTASAAMLTGPRERIQLRS